MEGPAAEALIVSQPSGSRGIRKALYKKKKKKKKRCGRLERLKSTLKQKDDKIAKLGAREVSFRR